METIQGDIVSTVMSDPEVYLKRFLQAPTGTLGRLSVNGKFICYTMERPWENNEQYISCIPEGVYDMALGRYNRGGYSAYHVLNVPNRRLIKIHVGNDMTDSLGCILPGSLCAWVNGGLYVRGSKGALNRFMDAMNGATNASITVAAEVLQESTAVYRNEAWKHQGL